MNRAIGSICTAALSTPTGAGTDTALLRWASAAQPGLPATHPSWYEKPLHTYPPSFAWPPGERIDIGGRSPQLWRMGSGCLMVVFDSGGESDSLVWRHMFPRVAAFARVVAYARAGLGQCEPELLPRTACSVADNL